MNDNLFKLAAEAGLGSERWNSTEEFHLFLERYGRYIVEECAIMSSNEKDVRRMFVYFGIER